MTALDQRNTAHVSVDALLAGAVRRHQAGALEEAESGYRRVLERDPAHPTALHMLGVVHLQRGEAAAAAEIIGRAVALRPEDAEARCNLGNALAILGRRAEARPHFETAVRLNPGFAQAHHNLGHLLRELGDAEGAGAAYRQAIAAQPAFPQALNDLGSLLKAGGDVAGAVAQYRRAVVLAPGFTDAWANLGNALQDLGETGEAEAACGRALALQPDHAPARCALGNVLRTKGDVAGAEAAYRQAVAAAPGYPDPWGALAALLEHLSRLDEAETLAMEGLSRHPGDPLLSLIAARCARRVGAVEQAVERLGGLDTAGLRLDLRRDIAFELGRLHDRAGESAAAFAAFAEGNRLDRLDGEARGVDKRAYRQEIAALTARVGADWCRTWLPLSSAAEQSPVFLIGFPRSGTTLLDQILDSHAGIVTLEEKPTIERVKTMLAARPQGYPDAIAALDEQAAAELRGRYFETVDRFLPDRGDRLLVDKYPLHIVDAALVLRLFPSARFILALRHPCDVCLSCFMQPFGHNNAMANFHSLEDAAALYASVMSLWQQTVAALNPAVHTVRYEDLVDDQAGESRRLLEFLGIPWDDAVLAFDAHARSRRRIDTPSYHQVTEPIYTRARYRWQRYAEHLAPVLPVLMPWIEAFGYEA